MLFIIYLFNLYFLDSTTFRGQGRNTKSLFVGFLVQMESLEFACEIIRPLEIFGGANIVPQLLTSATNVNCQASRVESLKNALHSLISVCKRMSLKQWGKIIFQGEFTFCSNFSKDLYEKLVLRVIMKMQVQKYMIASSEKLSPQCES